MKLPKAEMPMLEPPIRAVHMGLFSTFDSLQEVHTYADSLIPLTHRNAVHALLGIYHNTLLKVLAEQS